MSATPTARRTAHAPSKLRIHRRTRTVGESAVHALSWLRVTLGFVFLWAFLDKLLALGFATGRAEDGTVDYFGPAAWINGGSPTSGFLEFGLDTKEPFLSFYSSLAGQAWVDWVYMLTFAAIGLALMLGVAVRLAAIGGAVWMIAMYTAAAVWPTNNPIVDEHIVYAVALAGIAWVAASDIGLGRKWRSLPFVRERRWLY